MNFEKEPIMNIVWKKVNDLSKNDYNPNIVFNNELNLLKFSIINNWFIQPILINNNWIIIDWFHRFMLSSTDKDILKKYNWYVPCVIFNISDEEAKTMTLRINKAKWSHMALQESEIIKSLIKAWVNKTEIQKQTWLTKDEIELFEKENVLKKRNLDKYKYSQAWEPEK